MFDRLARRYRLANGLMTLGRDRAWRRTAIRAAALPPGGRLLDVGAGTGEFACAALKLDARARIAAIDFSPGMLAVGRRADRAKRIAWCCGDARRLPFGDGAFDAATSGFLLRNVPDALAVLREQVRVVRPGGRVVCLETAPPAAHRARLMTRAYLRHVIPALGRLISGDRWAYRHLRDSTEAFHAPAELAALMRAAGLERVEHTPCTLGVAAIHAGVVPLPGRTS